MSKKNNDSIEEFFKKGVRKSDITFRESDWQKMERMLDEKAMVGSASTSRPLKRIIIGAVIVALLSSLYFLIPGSEQESLPSRDKKVVAKDGTSKVDNKETNKVESLSNKSGHEVVANSEAADQDQSTPQNVAVDKKPQIESAKQLAANANSARSTNATVNQKTSGSSRGAQTTNKQQLTTNPTASQSRAESDNVISSKAGSEQRRSSNALTNESLSEATTKRLKETELNSAVVESQQASSTKIKEATQTPVFVQSNELVQKESTLVQPVQAEKTSSGDNVSVVSSNKSTNTRSSNLSGDITIAQEDTLQVATAAEELIDPVAEQDKGENDNDETISPSRWNVAFVFAPEFSSTSFDKQSVPGSAYGLTIGYRIVNRLMISTGVIKTYKKYVGYGEDYQPPAGYWQFRTNGIVPDEVSGQCSVIEVPLMLQYDVLQREKSRFFAAAGVSSYRMLNEKYAYTFNEPNDGAADGWSTDQPSSYYFSVGHLSLGYDHRLYRGLHVGIEPYVKIPFGGIGWSNVNLLTMGGYLNVRYKFSKRN
jgi:hypothetical protein